MDAELEREGFFAVEEYDRARRDLTPYRGYRCPACKGVHPSSPSLMGNGHEEGCWLRAALAEAKARPWRGVGVELIAAERQRQLDVEGWTPEHDADHEDGVLTDAAVAYIWNDEELWPFGGGWKPGSDEDRKRRLVKAGALIAAEIDRLSRTGVKDG